MTDAFFEEKLNELKHIELVYYIVHNYLKRFLKYPILPLNKDYLNFYIPFRKINPQV